VREAQEEIERRLAEAKAQLRRTAAELTARKAEEILGREITQDDRRRMVEESVENLRQVPR